MLTNAICNLQDTDGLSKLVLCALMVSRLLGVRFVPFIHDSTCRIMETGKIWMFIIKK